MLKKVLSHKIQNVVLVLLLGVSHQVKAEVFAQLYGGDGYTQKHNASVNLPDADISGTHKNLKFDNAAIIGGKIIYWINTVPYVGFGLDASYYFGPDQKAQTSVTNLCVMGEGCSESAENIKKFNNNVTAIAFELMLRYPMLKSAQFAKGRFQPYLTAGPAVFITTLTDTDNFIPAGQSSTYTSLDFQAGAGFILFLTDRIGVFIEYRDTNFLVKDKYYNKRVVNNITLGSTLGKATFNIQSIVGGVTYSF